MLMEFFNCVIKDVVVLSFISRVSGLKGIFLVFNKGSGIFEKLVWIRGLRWLICG